jgi:RNA polymerase sigma-70 factor (ECF subfamily)
VKPSSGMWLEMGVRPTPRGSLTADEQLLLERLFVEIGPRLAAYVRHAYGRDADAEDVVAETFCRAARNMGALRACRRQDLYLVTIVRNMCRDRFRRPRLQWLSADGTEEHAVQEALPADAIAGHEEVANLRAAVHDLPAGLREVVVLRLSTGLRFEEIAEVLQIPLGTALSRMHAATERLRAMLGDDHES